MPCSPKFIADKLRYRNEVESLHTIRGGPNRSLDEAVPPEERRRLHARFVGTPDGEEHLQPPYCDDHFCVCRTLK